MTKCGIDLVFIPDFKKQVGRGGEEFLRRIFLASELKNTEISHLAGVFAAKEAVMKALGIKAGSWHKIEVSYDKKGKPKVWVLGKGVKKCDLSIAHAGNYAVAVFVTEV
jgi:phosphopantetheine--protein transferase-like protein